MDNKSKQVLLKLLNELEDLRANLLVTSVHPSLKMSHADAHDAKTNALKVHENHYAALRKEIESL